MNARPLSLQRAIDNLIDNSLKYGPRAKLLLRADSRFAYIFIEDEGASMSEETLNELITPFKREQTTSLVYGLGLDLRLLLQLLSSTEEHLVLSALKKV